MNAYLPCQPEVVWQVGLFLGAVLLLGLGITWLRWVRLARILAWALTVGAVAVVERLSAGEPAGFRMMALIVALLWAMKAVVSVEDRAAGQAPLRACEETCYYNSRRRLRWKGGQAMSTPSNPKQRSGQGDPHGAGRPDPLATRSAASPAGPTADHPAADAASPRLRSPDRGQLLCPATIDELLEADHPARAVWSYVEGLDLSPWYDRIRSRDSLPGRPAIDPRLLVALWLYATLAGYTSARELAELCIRHDAFRWLAGGIAVNYHTLSDFRSEDPVLLGGLLEESVERLRRQGLVDLDRIAQDGVRVRASAGAASFHRRETLERLLEEAIAEVERLQRRQAEVESKAAEAQGGASRVEARVPPESARRQAAELRHAEDRLDRVDRAVERLPELEAKIKPGEKKQARVSTTDPEATVMKMADGGFRPAYNVQFCTACDGQVIVGVEVVTTGSDQGQMPPMLDQVEERLGRGPEEMLVDGGFVNKGDVEEAHAKGVTVYAPVPKPKKEEIDRYQPKATDGEGVAAWRRRMGTTEAKRQFPVSI